MFFGVRLRSLFTSRWFALLWAVLVILTAIQFVGPGDDSTGGQSGQGDAVAACPDCGSDGLTNEQRRAIANAF